MTSSSPRSVRAAAAIPTRHLRVGAWLLAVAALAAVVALRSSAPAAASDSGGTGSGYGWVDNKGGGPHAAYDWIDISASGQNIGHCDDCMRPVDIGFTFRYFGTDYTSVNVGANGVLQFTYTSTQWGPFELPDGHFGGPVMLPFWSDWDPTSGGDIFAETTSWHGQTALVVEWNNVASWDCDRGGAAATWEVILLADGQFVFQYKDTDLGDRFCDRGADMTVGIQRDAFACYHQYSNQEDAVPDRTAIAWAPQVDACGAAVAATATPVPATGTPAATETSEPDATSTATVDAPTPPPLVARADVAVTATPSTGTLGESSSPARRDQGPLPRVGSGPSSRSEPSRAAAATELLVFGAIMAAAGCAMRRRRTHQ